MTPRMGRPPISDVWALGVQLELWGPSKASAARLDRRPGPSRRELEQFARESGRAITVHPDGRWVVGGGG